MAMSEKSLVFRDISYTVANQKILNNISLTLNDNEIVVILGPSGVGKSTLLNLAIGFDKPQKGEIHNTFHRMSCVYQEPRLLPWLSALQNIELALKPYPMSASAKRQAALRVGGTMGLSVQDLQKYPVHLSGGMARRVGLARGLVNQPDLLLLDEPFSGVDIATKESLCQHLISEIASTQLSAILVTHDLLEAVYLANRIVVLDREFGLSESIFIEEPYTSRNLQWRFEKASYLLKQEALQRVFKQS